MWWNSWHLLWKLNSTILGRRNFAFKYLLLSMNQITFQLGAFNHCCCLFNLLRELFFHQVNKAAPHPGSALIWRQILPGELSGKATCAIEKRVGKLPWGFASWRIILPQGQSPWLWHTPREQQAQASTCIVSAPLKHLLFQWKSTWEGDFSFLV